MRTVKSNLIKMLTIALVVCLGVFVALIPMTKSPVNADEVSFSITGTSINGAQKGLSFNGSLTGTPDDYGILVYPAGETAIDDTKTVKENEEALDALNFLKQKSAAICFNRDTMLTWESVGDENVDEILNKFYAKDFTATPYFVVGEETFYGEAYTTNMVTVAEANVSSNSKAESDVALEVLGYEVIDNAEIEAGLEFNDEKDGFIYPVEVYVNGEQAFFLEGADIEITGVSLHESINAKKVNSNVVDIKVVLEHAEDMDENEVYLRKTVYYRDASFYNMIISNVTELKTALDYSGANTKNNYGFFKMDSDITLTEALTITAIGGTNNYSKGKGFLGLFDGDGHTIDFAGTNLANGLFGTFCYNFSGDGTGEQPSAQLTIKNLAIVNFKGAYNATVFAKMAVNHSHSEKAVPHFENIYVKGIAGQLAPTLITIPGPTVMKNVLVDATGTSSDKYFTDAVYGDASGKGYIQTRSYRSGTLFMQLDYFGDGSKSSFDNVISIGKTPLAFNPAHTNWRSYATKHVAVGDGTYNHYVEFSAFSADYNQYGAYAGNVTQGDIIVQTGLKANFLALVKNNPGTADLAGAYCATCYNQFSLSTSATCPDCDKAMKSSTNLWNEKAIYIWGLHDLTNYEEPIGRLTSANGCNYTGFFKLDGTYKYNDYDALIASNYDYSSFLGEDGNNFWKAEGGKLYWHASPITADFNEAVSFDASTGELLTTKAPELDKVAKVTVGTNELTVENGGIIPTETGYKLNALASGSVDTNGVPYMDNTNSTSNATAITIVTKTNDYYNFNNVEYFNQVIYDVEDLRQVVQVDFTYAATNTIASRKLGFFALANDITLGEGEQNQSNVIGVDYTGFSAYGSNVSNAARNGFNGQFDGKGHSIDFNRNYQSYGIFGSFNSVWNQAPTLKAPITVKNLAVLNYKANAPVFAFYVNEDNYNSNVEVVFSNIYVKMHGDDAANGLIKHGGLFRTNNVLIDSRGTTNDVYTSNAAYGENIVGKAAIPAYNGGLLFEANRYGHRYYTKNTMQYIENVVTLGKAPIVWATGYKADSWYAGVVKHTLDSDSGKYVHTIKNPAGWTDAIGNSGYKTNAGSALRLEMYIGYAGNQTVADIPSIASIKANFLALVEDYDGSAALPGAYCATCYDQFSLTVDGTAVCPSCEGNPVMTVVAKDIWSSPAVYNWELQDLTAYDSTTGFSDTNAIMVFPGVSKYIDADAMTAAYTANNNTFASFTGDAGNGLWKVVDGMLTWVGAVA